jgi:hypothetical protein
MNDYRIQSRSNAYRRRRTRVAKRLVVGTLIVLAWIAVALLMVGVSDSFGATPSPAPGTPEAYAILVRNDCQDLMDKTRQRLGRAPDCFILPHGETGNQGLVGLTDDLVTEAMGGNPKILMPMRFKDLNPYGSILEDHDYRYSAQEYQTVMTLIQVSGWGVTDAQRINASCQTAYQLGHKFDLDMLHQGRFTQAQFDESEQQVRDMARRNDCLR